MTKSHQELLARRAAASVTTSSDNMVTDQILQKVTHPSPQSAGFARYGEYSVDMSTGVPAISIPLYTLDTGDFNLPISISYHAGGIKVMDVSSPVGLGWSLMAGGVITRTVCAQADRTGSSYNLYFKNRDDVAAAKADSGKGPDWWNAVMAGNPAYDSETDRYSYSFAGKNGIFRYRSSDRSIFTVPHDPIKITETSNGFKIVDTDGTQYWFEAKETSWPQSGAQAVTAWYLSRIETAERHNVINFTYSSGQTYQVRYRSEVYEEGLSYAWNSYSSAHLEEFYLASFDSRYQWYCHSVPRLDTISWNNVSVSFSYATDRQDAQKERLLSMTVTDASRRVRYAQFDNNHYFGNSIKNYRMQLEGVSLYGSDSVSPDVYTFTYNSLTPPNHYNFNPSSSLTGTDRWSHEDYWGYWNGRDNEHQIPDGMVPGYTTANRDPRESNMKMCSLESISYPTGGRTVFAMEANRIGTRLIGGLRVASISSYDGDGTLLEKKSYSYADASESIPVTSDLFSYYDDVWYYVGYTGTGYPVGPAGGEEHYFAVSNPILPLTGWSGSPVFYATVTEFSGGTSGSNLGKTVCHYMQDFESSHPDSDEDWYALPLHMRFYSALYNDDEGVVPALLTSREVYRNNGNGTYTLQHTEQYTYTELTPPDYHFVTGVRLVRRGFGFVFTDYPLTGSCAPYPDNATFYDSIYATNALAYRRLRLLTGKTVTDHTSGVSTQYSYTYDSSLRTLHPLSESFTNSDGTVMRTDMTYPFLESGGAYVSMVSSNMVDTVTSRSWNCDGQLRKRIRTAYKTSGSFIVPDKVTLTMSASASVQSRTLLSCDTYNSLTGALTGYTTDNGVSRTVLWGYGNRYPIAEISGIGYSRVSAAVGNSLIQSISNCTVSNASTLLVQLRSLLAASEPTALVATTTYIPGVGAGSITSASGSETVYEYDSLGRLVKVSDNLGEIESYTYTRASGSSSSWTPNRVEKSVKKNASSSDTARIRTSVWYDGLGRSVSGLASGASPSGGNLLTFSEYDLCGRAVKEWLPVVSSSQRLGASAFRNAAVTTYGSSDGSYAFTENVYESSALDRKVRIQGPGAAWQNGHGISIDIMGNSASTSSDLFCKKYKVNPSSSYDAVEDGLYAAGQLTVQRTTDEDGNLSYTFTDKAGRLVLERGVSSAGVRHDTYHVYDGAGLLRFVLQPKYQDEATEKFYRCAFKYYYDNKTNITGYGTPGAGIEDRVYDSSNRMVFSRTAVQRLQGRWSFYTYDNLGRLVTMGENSSQSTSGGTVFVRNHYDSYSFSGSGGFSDSSYPRSGSYAKGRLTGQEVYVHAGSGISPYSQYIYRTFEYDSRGHAIRTVCNNPVSSSYGLDITAVTWSHTGKVLTTTTTRQGNSQVVPPAVTRLYAYDSMDRLTRIQDSTSGGLYRLIANYAYDDLGRLSSKSFGGGFTNIQTFGYDIRGAVTTLSHPAFTQSLTYCDAVSGKGYNGNVTGMTWTGGSSSQSKTYNYTYDGLGRMLGATYSSPAGGNYSEVISGYDRNGNMTGIVRNGSQSISMSYTGNLMTSAGGHACTYDDNGRLVSDARRGISSITYTPDGLPLGISFSNGSSVSYAYSADGVKLRCRHSDGFTRDWCSDAIYKNGTARMLLHEEGYLDLSTGGSNPPARFFVKDHLGSVRAVVAAGGAVQESTDYYPLGGMFNASGTSVQPHKFSGKEWDSFSGLNTFDFGARTYDPYTGRWLTQDPMANKYFAHSPYVYCAGNPVRFVDPDGMDIWRFDQKGRPVDKTPIPDTNHDAFVIVNQNDQGEWTEIEESRVSLPYGTISESSEGVILFSINGDDNAFKVFESMSNNTNAEWSLVTYKNGKRAEVGTSNQENSNKTILLSISNNESNLRNVIHSHLSEPYPSGADRHHYSIIKQRNQTQIPIFQIYHVPTGLYINYNETGPLYDPSFYEVY